MESRESRLGRRMCDYPGMSAYIWNEGDTLMAVALRYGVTEQAIIDANPGVSFGMGEPEPGTTICIPPRALMCPDGVLHPVRSGETMESVARAHGVTTLALMERNPYVDPEDLQVGMLLCVPRRTPTPTPPPTPTPVPRPIPIPPTPVPVPPPATIPVPIPAPPSIQCPPGYGNGVVRYGESYVDILLRYDISYQAFRLANPTLQIERLLPGQRYCIPPSGSRGLCGSGTESYVIEIGETLRSLAGKFRTSQAALLRLNPALAPSDFIPGRVICVVPVATAPLGSSPG